MQRFSSTSSATKKSTHSILERLAQQRKNNHPWEQFFERMVALSQAQTKNASLKIATLMSIFAMAAATDLDQDDDPSPLTPSEKEKADIYILPIFGGFSLIVVVTVIYLLCRQNCRSDPMYTMEFPRLRSELPPVEDTLYEISSSMIVEEEVRVVKTKPSAPTNAERLEKMIEQLAEAEIEYEIFYPEHFLCAITKEIMTDPVMVNDGHSYEKAQIILQKESGNAKCPLNTSIKITYMHDNLDLKLSIQEFIETEEKTVAELIANKNKPKMGR